MLLATKVPFLDLRVPSHERTLLLNAIDAVFQHGRLVLGPEVAELECAVAKECQRKFAVGVNSGTDALFLALKALNIGPKDEVITTSLSWIATANAIAMTGATPVFADIRRDLNLDPAHVERLITSRTKAIVPVHYTGKMCDMDALSALAHQHSIPLVEDAAQAFGALYKGRPAGSFGMMACFSMNPMKVFAACGEAGMVLTDEATLSEKLISLRYNGTVNKEICIASSLNCRLDTIQAAILLQRLKNVPAILARRREIADFYNKRLAPYVHVPLEKEGCFDVYYTYTIQTPKRDALKHFLETRGIETKIQHPYLMSQQSMYRQGVKEPLTRAEEIVREVLCLPAHEKLGPQELEYVVECVEAFFRE